MRALQNYCQIQSMGSIIPSSMAALASPPYKQPAHGSSPWAALSDSGARFSSTATFPTSLWDGIRLRRQLHRGRGRLLALAGSPLVFGGSDQHPLLLNRRNCCFHGTTPFLVDRMGKRTNPQDVYADIARSLLVVSSLLHCALFGDFVGSTLHKSSKLASRHAKGRK